MFGSRNVATIERDYRVNVESYGGAAITGDLFSTVSSIASILVEIDYLFCASSDSRCR